MTTGLQTLESDEANNKLPDWNNIKHAMSVGFDNTFADRNDETDGGDGYWFKRSCLFEKDDTGNYIMEKSDIFELFWNFLQPFLQKIISREIDGKIDIPFEQVVFIKNGKSYRIDVAQYMHDSSKKGQQHFAALNELWASISENERVKFPGSLSLMISEGGCQAGRGSMTLRIRIQKNTQEVVSGNTTTVHNIL